MAEIVNIPMVEYLALARDSRSSICDYNDSPENYHGRHVSGDIPAKSETSKMEFGSVVDAFITEGVEPSLEIPDDVVVIPTSCLKKNGHRNTAGDNWKELIAENHRTPLGNFWTEKECDKYVQEREAIRASCYAIRDQVAAHKGARSVLLAEDRICQPTILFEINGVKLKARPDVVPQRFRVIGDMKISASISTKFFTNRVSDFGYDIQGWLSAFGWMLATDESEMRPFVNVVIREKPPYEVRAFELNQNFMDRGRAYAMEAIEGIKRCQDSGVWRPGNHGEIEKVNPPNYMAVRRAEESELVAA